MLKLQKHHVEAIVRAGLISGNIPDDYDALCDEAFDALNNGPEVRSWTAEQDKGAYSIVIKGVPGAYIIQALEYDDLGPFETISKAEQEVKVQYGEFIIEE
jgi:hypothetical protein